MSKVIVVIIKYKEPVKKIPGVKTIIVDNTNNNRGFAKAANVGIKKALKKGADKIILVNPDIQINKDQIVKLANSKYDIVSPVLRDHKLDYGGRINWWIGRTTHDTSFWPESRIPKNVKDAGVAQHDIDYVSGACMSIDNKVFEKIGFFDEQFFMYFEDTDFCLRAKQKKLLVGIENTVIVNHKLTKNYNKNTLAWKSNVIFVKKWVPIYFRPLAYIYLILLWFRLLF